MVPEHDELVLLHSECNAVLRNAPTRALAAPCRRSWYGLAGAGGEEPEAAVGDGGQGTDGKVEGVRDHGALVEGEEVDAREAAGGGLRVREADDAGGVREPGSKQRHEGLG